MPSSPKSAYKSIAKEHERINALQGYFKFKERKQ